ncbi:helix-turn-helix transcriptional regulator [Echinicola jeungdonensis]|uniref:AraC family transcriptional regulator n=1 Tax=Echinicola jeungdonensis TaxID=709343 RepID=A0ABV5J4R6_9BACT|nr:helix-turn-helix transcriptional regulator [Echinicola jeungdonensis]MDN3667987.1 helix-turn-helix transcriptional regulator [Echinicola jeungdonensis]
MQNEIENILFSRFVKQTIPFEFLPIQELYKRVSKKNYDLSIPHRIEFHALIIVLEGESYHTVDFKKEALSPGVILTINKGQVHSFHKELTIKGYVIGLEENFITQNTSDKNLFQFLQIFHTPKIQIVKENLSTLKPIFQLIENFLNDEKAILKSEIIHSTFMTLLFQIKRLACNQHKTFDSQRFKNFYLFKELISKHYNETHNAKDYAKKLNMSYNYLNEICKEIVNKTAKEFIDSWLLLEIKRNISEKKHTSQEIAFKMGFNEPSNFIRFFKKHTKITPIQFQEELKN